MLAGAEAQARIQHHDRLYFSRAALAPARFDKQLTANFNGLEMPFPRFGPIFPAHFQQSDPAAAGIQPATVDSLQAGEKGLANFARPDGFLLKISRDRAGAGLQVEIDRNRLAEGCAERFSDGILGFGCRDDGNAPERFGCLHFLKWWGERPREPLWHCENRLAGSLAPPDYSVTLQSPATA